MNSNIYELSKISQNDLIARICQEDDSDNEDDAVPIKKVEKILKKKQSNKRKNSEIFSSVKVSPKDFEEILLASSSEDSENEYKLSPMRKRFSPQKNQTSSSECTSTSPYKSDLDISFNENDLAEYKRNKLEYFEVKYLSTFKEFKSKWGDPLGCIIKEIADSFNLPVNQVSLFYKDKRISTDSTLLSIQFESSDYLDLYFSKKQNTSSENVEDHPDTFKLFFIDEKKKKFTIRGLREKMKVSELISRISKETSKPVSSIRIYFEGDRLEESRTLQHYELEDEYLCELKFQ